MIITDLPFSEYLARPCLSNSGIGKLLQSPAHFAFGDDSTSRAMNVGSIVHKLVLEPEKFDDEYHPCQLDRRTKEGKALAAELEQSGRQPITLADYDAARAMRDSIMSHPVAGELLSLPGDSEVSLFGEISGVQMKGRADRITANRSLIIDLKTTSDGSQKATQRSVMTYGYHRQEALYTSLMACNGHSTAFMFVSVETSRPYVVSVYELDAELVNRGMESVLDGIEIFKRCKESGRWPGYSDQVMRIAAPSWMQ